MIVTVTPEVENSLRALAAQKSIDAAALGGSMLEEALREKGLLANSNGLEHETDKDPHSLSRAIERMRSRTPEEVDAMRERVLKQASQPLPLPSSQTIFDIIPSLRGNETEEEVQLALARLS
jgi:hypothetical protein